jgi:hypothetical protein
MRSRTSMLLTITALTLGAALARAAEPIWVAGELTCKTTGRHAVPVERHFRQLVRLRRRLQS